MKTNLISRMKGVGLAATLALVAGCGGNHPDWNDPQVAKRVISECGAPILNYTQGLVERASSYDIDGDGTQDVIRNVGHDLFYSPGFKSLVASGKVKYVLDPNTPEMSSELADKLNDYDRLAKEIALDLAKANQQVHKQ